MTVIKLPRNLEFDLDEIPDDFEAQIQQAFSDYTYGIAEDYTFQDKLAFIDLCVAMLHGNKYEDDAVMDLVKDSMENDLNEGQFPQEEDYFSFEYMAYCYREGKESQKMYSKQFGGRYRDHHIEEKIEKLILRILTAVVMWGVDLEIGKERCALIADGNLTVSDSIFVRDLEKVYSVEFMEYTNASHQTVCHNSKEMCYLEVGDTPFLVRESELEYYRNFGMGYKSINFAGKITKEKQNFISTAQATK